MWRAEKVCTLHKWWNSPSWLLPGMRGCREHCSMSSVPAITGNAIVQYLGAEESHFWPAAPPVALLQVQDLLLCWWVWAWREGFIPIPAGQQTVGNKFLQTSWGDFTPNRNTEQPCDCSKLNWRRTARGGRQEAEKRKTANKWPGRLISSAWVRQGAHSVPFNVILGHNWGCIHCLRVFENLIAAVEGTAGTGEVWEEKTTTYMKYSFGWFGGMLTEHRSSLDYGYFLKTFS